LHQDLSIGDDDLYITISLSEKHKFRVVPEHGQYGKLVFTTVAEPQSPALAQSTGSPHPSHPTPSIMLASAIQKCDGPFQFLTEDHADQNGSLRIHPFLSPKVAVPKGQHGMCALSPDMRKAIFHAQFFAQVEDTLDGIDMNDVDEERKQRAISSASLRDVPLTVELPKNGAYPSCLSPYSPS